jgi:hypothetical protein
MSVVNGQCVSEPSARGQFPSSLCHAAQRGVTMDGLCGSLNEVGVTGKVRVGEQRQFRTLYVSQCAVS